MDDIEAVMKLMANTTAGPPGPMVGLHGYMRPNLKPDPALQLEFEAKLAALEAVLPSFPLRQERSPLGLTHPPGGQTDDHATDL